MYYSLVSCYRRPFKAIKACSQFHTDSRRAKETLSWTLNCVNTSDCKEDSGGRKKRTRRMTKRTQMMTRKLLRMMDSLLTNLQLTKLRTRKR